ncbi:diacylglycerol/lipid kinase family protein [Streptomyces triticiradicis]|uniref:Diacylglycerol kinase n=1 Tax=Streptomyces triticiradicis TaxID=2651189 RepID=A0A7J5DHT6_9ACTN|nr:diacylglycerol kinase family protein [Streptomyces triticiradicis]KAB1988208.1 diacylglycerol kinase [Streptomyces triticiradicis]
MAAPRWARTVLVVVNPAAGAVDAALVDEVTRHCRSWTDDLGLVTAQDPGETEDAAAKAYENGVDAIVVLGGDGTTRAVASGIARARSRSPHGPGANSGAMLNLPAGTGNSFYREIWSDHPWQQALRAALATERPRIRGIDMARIVELDTLVLLGACSGLVAEALVTAGRLPQVPGRERYRQAVAQTLRTFRPYPGRVTVDGVVVHEGTAVLANVGGGRYRGGQFKVLPRSELDDGLLDVCVVGGELDPAALPGLTADGSHLERPECVYARGRRITLERTDGEPLTFEHDGELPAADADRYTIGVLPDILPVLAPPRT